jgi:hypothetical protein
MRVAQIDAPQMSSDNRTYMESNTLSYYVAINTWLHMLKQYSGYSWTHFAHRITTYGLIDTIKYCQDQARAFIRHEEIDDFMKIFYTSITLGTNDSVFEKRNIDRDRATTFLFLLRYLKRFSPNNNDIIQDESMKDFIATENRVKLSVRREYNPFVINLVKDEIARMYPWKTICRQIEKLSVDDMEFTTGVCRGTKSDLRSKYQYLAKSEYCDDFFLKPFGVRVVTSLSVNDPRFKAERIKVVKPAPVPKSYKSSRIIAPENVYRQGMGKAIERIFRRIDHHRFYDTPDSINSYKKIVMNLEDQRVNQKLAQRGSLTGQYATLDASHASDMISKVLFRSVFPTAFVKAVEPYLDDYIEYPNGQVRPMQMMSTAGHSLTFRLETIVYLAIARAATHLSQRMGAGQDEIFNCWAYGDDTIVPSYAAETAIDFFSSLGLVINVDKSYYSLDLLYRESCGEEYYAGQECTSLYFPRFPLKGMISNSGVVLSEYVYHDGRYDTYSTSTTMLIALQKKLYPYSKDAAFFVLEILRASDKNMTTSIPYDETSTDPWGLLDTGKPKKNPSYEIVKVKYDETKKVRASSKHVPRASIFCQDAQLARIVKKIGDEPTFLSDGAYEEFQRLAELDRYHSCPTMVNSEKGDDGHDDWLYQSYKYREFLLHGPRFNSSLDELLGVSSPSISYAEFCGKRELKQKFILR